MEVDGKPVAVNGEDESDAFGFSKSNGNQKKAAPWWTDTLTDLRKKTNKLRRLYQRTINDQELREQRREEYLQQKRIYQNMMRGSKNKNKNEAVTSVTKDTLFYKMDHPKTGVAVIFNHEKFVIPHLRERTGTQEDCNNLKNCLEYIGFNVTVCQDLDSKGIKQKLEEISEMDFSDMDCLVICVLSHGESGIIYANDAAYVQEDLWGNFTADKCKTLAGKPKLFFIQACQGSKLDVGMTLNVEVDSNPAYKIPVHADFLIAYSTIPGFYSWRNTGKGSWFIQSLTAEFKENCFKYDILTLLTFVNRRVAVDFESNVPGDRVMNAKKQIPCITSMLIRLLRFEEKKKK